MELGLFIVIVLLFLATLDLAVGVSNDAVNFINCAYGSNAGSLKKILLISAIGVFVGVLFSGGMLEVARKGVFHPHQFMMMELLIIFLAVMIGDIILLDIFNSYGMPTSTTVSIVFGLAGAAVAMALIKIDKTGESFNVLSKYINIQNIFKIASGIFLSIIIAFISGSLIQYLTRMIFTFDYKKRFEKYGSIWGSIVITVLSAFIIFKGTKNASFVPAEITGWLKENLWIFAGFMFIFWTIVLQILIKFTKTNILKGIVLFGTFALAMAFAANDLVNFIGAPIAGLNAYDLADGTIGNPFQSIVNGTINASMTGMNEKVPVNMFILVAAATVMIVTLYTSKKALRVVRTGIDLGKQGDVNEKFETNIVGRFLVKAALDIFKIVRRIVPDSIAEAVKARFDLSKYQPETDESGNEPAFDLIRASVILFVSAALITVATSMKLPLSTTYVTFITAMAAALPDKAWDRESASYRVSGVVSVITGWLFTALMAFLIEFALVFLIDRGRLWAIIPLLGFIGYLMIRSNRKAKKQYMEEETAARDLAHRTEDTKLESIKYVMNEVHLFMKQVIETLCLSNKGLGDADIEQLKQAKETTDKIQSKSNIIQRNIIRIMGSFDEPDPSIEFIHSKVMINIQDIEGRIKSIARRNHKYINNQHDELLPDQVAELNEIGRVFNEFVVNAAEKISTGHFDFDKEFKSEIKSFKKLIKQHNKSQINRLKDDEGKLRRSMLYLNLLFEIRNMCDDMLHLFSNTKKVYTHNTQDI